MGLEAPSALTRQTAEGPCEQPVVNNFQELRPDPLSLSFPPSLGGGAEAVTSGGGKWGFSKPLPDPAVCFVTRLTDDDAFVM